MQNSLQLARFYASARKSCEWRDSESGYVKYVTLKAKFWCAPRTDYLDSHRPHYYRRFKHCQLKWKMILTAPIETTYPWYIACRPLRIYLSCWYWVFSCGCVDSVLLFALLLLLYVSKRWQGRGHVIISWKFRPDKIWIGIGASLLSSVIPRWQ